VIGYDTQDVIIPFPASLKSGVSSYFAEKMNFSFENLDQL
jgi:hypothetical protein